MSIKLKGSTDGSVTLQAPADTSPTGTDKTLTLPTTTGSANQFVKNGGTAGTLEYSSMVETSTGVGIGGVTSPFDKLQVRTVTDANFVFSSSGGTEASFEVFNNAGSSNTPLNYRASEHKFKIQGNEKMRLDSGGRLLAGTTASSGNFRAVLQGNAGNDNAGGDLLLARGAATPANSQALGLVGFSDNTHTISGQIQCNRDGGTWSSTSKPTLMTFQTCADGSTTPTEKMRVDSSGRFRVPGYGINVAANTDISFGDYGYSGGGGTDGVLARHSGNAYLSVDDFFKIRDNINNSENKEFEFNTSSGSAGADNNWNSNNFDFAEMFEWSDGNPNAEDRIGYSVAVDGLTGKIKIAEEGDVPIGIVSGTASFVANAGELQWAGRRQRDEWGRFVYEPAVTVDDEGNEVPLLDDEGNQRTKPAINPEWDEARFNSYVPRSQRPEWACIGVVGQVYMRKGCPVDARWIKLKEVDSVKDLWLVR